MRNIKQPSGCGAIGQQYALSCCWLAKRGLIASLEKFLMDCGILQ
jgi:hypothetical protein